MSLKQRARALAGLAAVLTLLGLIVADTLSGQITLSLEDKLLLTSLVSGLLGVDFALDQLNQSLGDSQND